MTAANAIAAPRRALIVIDVQNEYFTGNLPIEFPEREGSLVNITRTMDAAAKQGIPVVIIQHEEQADAPIFAHGSNGWELHPQVASRPRSHLIKKSMASAFAGTDLAQWLAEHGIDTLTVVGYMTHNCDAATIFHARHAGFTVEFLADASGSLPYANAAGSATAEEIHRVMSVVFHSSFASVTTTAEWIAAAQAGQTIGRDNVLLSNRRARGL